MYFNYLGWLLIVLFIKQVDKLIYYLLNIRFNFAAWIIEYLRLLKYLTFNKLKNKEKYA